MRAMRQSAQARREEAHEDRTPSTIVSSAASRRVGLWVAQGSPTRRALAGVRSRGEATTGQNVRAWEVARQVKDGKQ